MNGTVAVGFAFHVLAELCFSSNLTKTPSGTNSKMDCLKEVIGVQLVKKFFAFW